MDTVSRSGGASWLPDLEAYLKGHPICSGGDEEHSVSERQGLVAAVKAAPQSAEAWRALLIFEEAHSSNITQQQPGGGDPSRVSLYHLYYWATQEVPRSKNQQKEAYLQLWLGFARQQWARSPDDARDTFKTLKNQHIGDASARLYYEWAVLEHSAGYISKALGIIAKGMRADAQPASLLQQLQGELQSGTFDLKAAGPATETITLDCGTVAHHAATTPAPSIGLGVKASLSGHPSTVRAPPSVLATAGHPRGSSMASCLKAPAAATAAAGAGAGQHDHHVARAVTFAADVHDAGVVLGAHGQPHRAGSVSASSQRTAAYTVEGHSGFLSNASSSPSRSMALGHDGTMPFSSGAVSYKSSTTESSTIDGLEEATISCGVTAAAAGEKGAAAVKPNTAPLAGGMTPAGGGGGGNTATLGLKRFGFKSRALRVGGSATDAPAALTAAAEQSTAAAAAAATEAPNASDEAAAAAGPASSSGAIAGDASWDVNSAGRKRRAAAESVPSPNVSPKLAAAVRHGQQCRVQPGEDAADEDGPAGASNCQDEPCAGQELSGSQGSGSGAVLAAAADPTTSTDEDSVPLVGSRLAARAQDRGTPMAAGRGIEAVVQGLGLWSSPVEGQLPSSLETTPSEVLPAADGTSTSSRHASKCAPSRGRQETSSSQQHQQAPPSSHQQVERSRRPLAAVPCPRAAVQPAGGDEDVPAAPTVVLPDVAAVTVTPAGPGRRGLVDPALQASTSHRAQASSEARQPAAAAAAREPLRPLQTQQHPPSAATQPEAPGKKQQQVAHVDAASQAAVATQAAQQRPQQPQQVQRQQAAPVQQQQQQARPHDKQQQQPPAAQQPDPAAVRQQPHQPPQQQRQRQAAQAPEPQVQQQQQQQQRQAPPQHQQQRQALPQQQQQQAPPQQQHHHQAPPQQQHQQAVRQLRPKEDPQTVFVQGVRYHKLECVGRGGSSKVFKVMGPGCKIYALKRIKLAGRDEEAASGFIDEINLLNSLRDKPNIIQLVESQVFTEEGLIYMVQEYGEIDLARLLAKHAASRKEAGALKDNLDENFIRLYWQQMLQAVAGVHEQRIVHSDLKPANFLLVEGQLKLIDFGIAKAINGDTTSIARESQVGTLNYMSPEAILGGTNNILGGPPMKVGRPSDVWSLGCILYQMVYGRTPFADLPFVPKMHAICNPQHRVSFPELANKDLMHVMQRCLNRDPKTRITLHELLDHSFLHPNRVAQPAATAAPPMLSEEQMKLLVAQLQAQLAAGASAGVPDLDKLTRELMQKLGTATLNSSSSASSSGNSSPRGTAGQQSAAQGTAAAHRQQQHPQQRQAGTGGLAGPDGSRPSSSRSRIPTAPQAGQPGWR